MYGSLGVASLGFEIGSDFQQDCDEFEEKVVPINMPALLFAAKNVNKPFLSIKGPDVFDMSVRHVNGEVRIAAHVSDSKMVNKISLDDKDFDSHVTGEQDITEVRLFIDVHPDDYREEIDISHSMNLVNVLDDNEQNDGLVLKAKEFSPGRHTLYLQATDSELYKGPVTSVFVDITELEVTRGSRLRGSSLRGSSR